MHTPDTNLHFFYLTNAWECHLCIIKLRNVRLYVPMKYIGKYCTDISKLSTNMAKLSVIEMWSN